jgi:hypothetical protein
MDKESVISQLKDLLRKEVWRFCRRDDRHWKEPIVATIRELHAAN